MRTSINPIRMNHLNVVLEDAVASMEHLTRLYDAQYLGENRYLAEKAVPEWRAYLATIGRTLFEVFVPHQFLLNARYGPHYLGAEYQVDMDDARQAVAERGIRIVRDIGSAFHTHPKDTCGIAFEFYGDFFIDNPNYERGAQVLPAEYWRDEHPLGLTGLRGFTLAVREPDRAIDFLGDFMTATVLYEEPRPAISARAVGLQVADSVIEVVAPTGDGALRDHIERAGEGIRSAVFTVRDIDRAQRYFTERGTKSVPGDGALVIPGELNLGLIFEFAEV